MDTLANTSITGTQSKLEVELACLHRLKRLLHTLDGTRARVTYSDNILSLVDYHSVFNGL